MIFNKSKSYPDLFEVSRCGKVKSVRTVSHLYAGSSPVIPAKHKYS